MMIEYVDESSDNVEYDRKTLIKGGYLFWAIICSNIVWSDFNKGLIFALVKFILILIFLFVFFYYLICLIIYW